MIRGASGSGKSSLLAEVAHRLAQADAHPIFLVGTAGGRAGFGSIAAGVRGFGAEVERANSLGLDATARLGHLGIRLRAHLAEMCGGRPLAIFVDDAHLLDTGSCDLLELLCSYGVEPTTLIVFATPTIAEHRSPWGELDRRLDSNPTTRQLDLDPLTVEDLAALVAHHRPELSLSGRAQLARWLATTSGGLPLVAVALFRLWEEQGDRGHETSVAGQTTALDLEGIEAVFHRLVQTASPRARTVGAAGAILGQRFRIAQLVALLGEEEASLFDVLDELVGQGHLVETGQLDEFEFTHRMIAEAFWRTMTASRRARLHRRAAELTTDVHALADHHVGADGLIPVAETMSAVLASARVHLAAGSFWESVWRFRQTIGVSAESSGGQGPAVEAGVLVDFARALALSGSRAASATIRRQAFEAAARDEDWTTALAAALSGLPEAENPDGEQDRLDQLLIIPAEGLATDRQLTQALAALRISAQLGLVDHAATWANKAAELAASDQQRGEAVLAHRFVNAIDRPPIQRLERLEHSDALSVDDRLRCRLQEFRAIDLLELGQLDRATSALDEFERLARATADPIRCWHALLFQALMAEIDGRWEEADARADEARSIGRSSGVSEADIVRLAQGYFRFRLLGRLDELAEAIEHVPMADAGSQLFRSARTSVLHAAGRWDEAIAEAVAIAEAATTKPSATSIQSLAIVLPVLADSPNDQLKRRVALALEPLRRGGLVIGAGIGMIASVDLALSAIDDRSELGLDERRSSALERAIRFGDETGHRALAVTARLELASVTGDDQLIIDAAERAGDTALAVLVPDRPVIDLRPDPARSGVGDGRNEPHRASLA